MQDFCSATVWKGEVGEWDYSPPRVGRIWGISGSHYNIPKAAFYLLKGDYRCPCKEAL